MDLTKATWFQLPQNMIAQNGVPLALMPNEEPPQMMAEMPQMPQPKAMPKAKSVVREVEIKSKMPMSVWDSPLVAGIQNDFGLRRSEIDEMNERINKLPERDPTDIQYANLRPLLSAADELAGTNYSKGYQAPKIDESLRTKLQELNEKKKQALADDQMKIMQYLNKDEQFDETMKYKDKFLSAMAGKASQGNANQDRSQEFKLRNEWDSDSVTKNSKTVLEGYEKINKSLQGQGRASDLSLIYGLMKMQDPASTVRESETEMAQTIGGFPQKTQAMFSSFVGKGRLTPEQRKAIVDEARSIRNAQLSRQKQVDDTYSNLAKDYGFDPKKVVINGMFRETPQAAGPKMVTVSNGSETYQIEESKVPQAQADGFQVVKEPKK